MSREIKFRVWDKELKEMSYTESVEWFDDGVYFRFNKHEEDLEHHLMMNSGIKDKNGIEIYEGDIIQFVGDGCKANGVVKYGIRRVHNEFNEKNELGFYVDWSSKLWWRRDLIFWSRKCEVIGNIYKNPELMWRCEGNVFKNS